MPKPTRNDPPLEEGTEPTTFELESSLKRQLEAIAETTERSLSGLLRFLVKQFLEKNGRRGV